MKKYKWIAESNDGAFTDESKNIFSTEEECYNDMRNSALEKMKWNTEYNDDLYDVDTISYDVIFSQKQIIHKSYSGVYTYKIVEVQEKQIINKGFLTYALTNGERIFGLIKDHYISDWNKYLPLYWSEVFVDGNQVSIHKKGMLLTNKTNAELCQLHEQSKINIH